MDKSTKIAVAVSGGVDSVYLLHWLIDNGYKNLLVVHFDHNLRPESSKDAEFVKSLARKFNLPYAGASTCVRCYCKSEKVSIWHPGWHDNPFGMRLTSYMISNKIADSSVPMSLMGLHKDVSFSFLTPNFGSCEAEMH